MKQKRLLLSILCGALCVTSPMPAFAEDVGAGETDISTTTTEDDAFMVTLPESITDASSADSVNFTYSVSGSIASNTTVTVNVEDENDTTDGVQVKVTDKGNNEDYVDMLLPKTEFSSADVAAGTSVDGTTTIGNLTAGTWTGTAKFLVDTTGSGIGSGDSGVTELSTGATLYDASGNVVATLDGSQIDFTGTNASLAPSTILANYPSVTKIEIADGTTSIGANAFNSCSNLKSVTIPSSVTSIGKDAFRNCKDLTEITIPNGVTNIGAGAFSGCIGISELIVPESVTTIGTNAFSDIANIIYNGSATGSPWGAESINSGSGATLLSVGSTYNLGGYEWVVAEQCDGYVVLQSEGVTSGTWPGYKMAKFGGKSNSIYTAGHIDGSDISDYDDKTMALYDDIKDVEYQNATYGSGLYLISYDKYYETVSYQNPLIYAAKGYQTFKSTDSIVGAFAWLGTRGTFRYADPYTQKYAYAVRGDYYSVDTWYQTQHKVIAPAFNLDLTKITVNGNTITSISSSVTTGDIGQSTGTILYDASGNVVATLDGSQIDFTGTNASLAPSTILANYPSVTKIEIADGTTSIGANAFKDCSNLKYVGIPSSVISIGDNAFSGCTGISCLTVPSSVTSIGADAFSGIAKVVYNGSATSDDYWGATDVIKNVNFVGYDVNDNFVMIGARGSESPAEVLVNYPSVTKVVITDRVTTIDTKAFADCDNLTSIIIPNSVTTIDTKAFADCNNLTSIIIPNSVTTLGSGVFSACYNLTSVTMSNAVTTIPASTFYNTSLTHFIIPDGVTTIGDSAFCYTHLTDITIPDSVIVIDEWAFSYTGLVNVTLSNNLKTIGKSAFAYCANLTDVNIPDSVMTIDTGAFYNVPHITYNGAATGSPWGAKSIN